MGIKDSINQLSISLQIRIGIFFVFSFSIVIILGLLMICLGVHYSSLKKYYNSLLYKDEMNLLDNIDQLIESGEGIFEVTSKIESFFYNQLFFNLKSSPFLLENIFEIDNTSFFFQNLSSEENKYLNYILPLINYSINPNSTNTFTNFLFFLPNNKVASYLKNDNLSDIINGIKNLTQSLNENKSCEKSIIYIENLNSIPFSSISLTINSANFISGVALFFNKNIIEIIIDSVLKGITNNIFVLISLKKKDKVLNKLLTPNMCNYIKKYAYLNNIAFNISIDNNINILNCFTNEDYIFKTNKNSLSENIFTKEKVSFDIYTNNSDNKIEQINSFILLKSFYPKNATNINCPYLFLTENYIVSKLGELNYNMNIISTECFYFIIFVFICNFFIWLFILNFIIITVFQISHSISDPIDKLIKIVSMSDNNNLGKENKELKNYLSTISYEDDSTINDLFMLCKQIIIGGFKQEEKKRKKKRKCINSYNNISLVKSNNMVIDENEIMENMKNKEINFFEKPNINKLQSNNFHKINNNNILNQKKKDIDFDHCELSKPIFNNKFYIWNEFQLTKDNEYFQIVKNELGEKNKKTVFGFFSKIIEKEENEK